MYKRRATHFNSKTHTTFTIETIKPRTNISKKDLHFKTYLILQCSKIKEKRLIDSRVDQK